MRLFAVNGQPLPQQQHTRRLHRARGAQPGSRNPIFLGQALNATLHHSDVCLQKIVHISKTEKSYHREVDHLARLHLMSDQRRNSPYNPYAVHAAGARAITKCTELIRVKT